MKLCTQVSTKEIKLKQMKKKMRIDKVKNRQENEIKERL